MKTQVEEIFHQVVELSAEARAHYFAEHDIDSVISGEIEALIGFDASSSNALKHAIAEVAERTLERFEPEGQLCGSYRLGKSLGRGGMGRVYLAERVDGEVAQRVAVKLLRGAADEHELRDRFLAERQILAGLSHPNIARLLDAGHCEDGQPYLVMEHVAGKPIDVYAAGSSILRKITLFIKVCSAVGYLHRNLVVHRDLKPANILVTEEGEPKLLDFGIAKILDLTTDSTVTNLRILTPDYASPEQIVGSRVTTASDIYSLGAVLYKLLTGRSPHRFQDDTQGMIDWEACIGNVTPPAKLAPALNGDLELILLKALRKEPQERYATIEQFAEDLECYLDSRPIRARRSDILYRTRKFLRRHWLPAAALFIALSSLTTSLVAVQRQRDASVRRFNEVRQLAKQLFTIEKDVRTLPGSTHARERIVKIALQYLERLSKEAGTDLALKAELASAYTEVANIQGGFRTMNLGHPDEAMVSLQRAERLFRDVCEAKPNDAAVLRAYIEAAESRSRIEYSEMNESGMAQTLRELRALVARYELAAPGNVDGWDFLGGIYESMSLVAGRLDLRTDGLELASKSVDFQRKAAALQSSVRTLGHLSSALGYYGRMQRSLGDLAGSLRTTAESLQIAKRLADGRPTDNVARINLAANYCYMASLFDEVGDISMGKPDEAIPWYEKAIELNRTIFQADTHENQIRHNMANTTWKLANLIRQRDPARAIALYDEAIGICRGMPPAIGRELQLGIILAESTFPLRWLHRNAEARARLSEARNIADATNNTAPDSPHMPLEAVARAEADWAMASGKGAQAAAIHQAWLERTHFGTKSVKRDLHSALTYAAHWQLLSEAYRESGQPDLATEADKREREILDFWKKAVPDNSRIAWPSLHS